MTRRKRPKSRRGIRRKGNRWEVSVRIKGLLHSATFPLDATDEEMQTWRKGQRANAPTVPAPGVGTLGRDAVRYLRTVKHKPDYVNQRTYLNRWIKHFGKYRHRHAITSVEIETALSTFRATLGPTTVRHHRTALINLWRTLDGKDAPNPASRTTRPADPEPRARAASLEHIRQVLAHLRPSQTRARLVLILTTGLPHKQIMQLTRDDWNKQKATLTVRGRSKGRGTAGRLIPLSAAGTKAMEDFDRWDCWGPFSASAMHSLVARACTTLEIPRFRPYDLRHTAGTLIYQLTGDLATTARMLGHSGTKTAERYTQEAWANIDRAAGAKLGAEVEKLLENSINTASKEPS